MTSTLKPEEPFIRRFTPCPTTTCLNLEQEIWTTENPAFPMDLTVRFTLVSHTRIKIYNRNLDRLSR